MMRLLFLLPFLFLFGSCNLQEREQRIQLQQDSLNRQKADLAILEKSLLLKESELEQRAHLLDSVQREDTSYLTDPTLTGAWDVRMICTETTCPGSAIGDTKNEVWRVSFQGKWMIVAAVSKNQIGRVYTGKYSKEGIVLEGDVNETEEAAAKTRIEVQLQVKDAKNIEGLRRIVREGDCVITYDLKLTRS